MKRAEVHLITGPSGAGKTARLTELYRELKREHPSWRFGGFLAPARYAGGEPVAYSLHCLHDGSRLPLVDRRPVFDRSLPVGRFFVNARLFDRCTGLLLDRLRDLDVLFIDEAGPLELSGGGWDRLIRRAIAQPRLRIFMAVRDKLAAQIRQHYGLDDRGML